MKVQLNSLAELDYKKWLQILLDAGNKFPFAWKMLLAISQQAMSLIDLMKPTTPVPATEALKLSHDPQQVHEFARKLQAHSAANINLDDETIQMEQKLAAHVSGTLDKHLKSGSGAPDESLKAIGDGSLLRNLFAFLQSNPQLLTLILSLFGVKLPAAVQV